MNCAEARFALAADPRSADAALAAHLAGCPACAAYAADMRELDARLRTALEIPVPPLDFPSTLYVDAPNVVPLRSARTPSTSRSTLRWAIAAGVATVAVVLGLLSGGYPRESLADAVVDHMAEEPQAWATLAPIPTTQVAATLRRAGFKAGPNLAPVTYLQSCFFRGHYVPHFVVQTRAGPRTVMLLRDEHVAARTSFDENGYRGVLVPTVEGSIAVLARDAGDLAGEAARIADSIHYVR